MAPTPAERLQVPIPTSLGPGEPGAGYPFAWSIYDWLSGEPAQRETIMDPIGLANDLADFLLALRSIDPTDGPQPGMHNWFRGGTLRTYDASARDALAKLADYLDVDLAVRAWEDALVSQWDGVDHWFHGDVATGNLLLDQGGLAAVIDFGTCGAGDPSCDLAIAWTLLTADARKTLRDRLTIDHGTWSRGHSWALWKALVQLAGAIEDGEEASGDITEGPNDERSLPEPRRRHTSWYGHVFD